jgi:hypothetical protein
MQPTLRGELGPGPNGPVAWTGTTEFDFWRRGSWMLGFLCGSSSGYVVGVGWGDELASCLHAEMVGGERGRLQQH